MSPEPQSGVAAAEAASAQVSEEEITRFVVERFLPGVTAAELDADYDLLTTGVIDSLGVLHVASWLEREHGARLPDSALNVRNFRSVAAIRRTLGGGGVA